MRGAIRTYRVLDLTDGYCLACGKILVDLGADVIKIESPGGDRARYLPPFYKDKPHPERSLICFAYNMGKKGITLNLEHDRGKEVFKSLVEISDIVIESYDPGYLDSIGLSYEVLSSVNPALVLTSITAFGQDGPYSHFKHSDLTVTALSGYLYLCGDPDRPPVRITAPITFYMASAEAAASSLIALYHSSGTGQGQRVDVSAQQVMAFVTANAPAFWELEKKLIVRSGKRRAELTTQVKAPQLWPCKDGWISFAIYGGQLGARVNIPLIAWMDSEGMSDDWLKSINWGELDMASIPDEFYDEAEKRLGEFFMRHTKAELFQGAIERQIILFPVYSIGDIIEDRQLRAREFWVRVEHPELGETIMYPGAFTKMSLTPITPKCRAPLLGEHNYSIYRNLLHMSRQEIESLRKEGAI